MHHVTRFQAGSSPLAESRLPPADPYESYTASSSYESGDESSAGAAWAAGAEGVGAAAAGAGTAYAAGGHSAELDYNGPELAHSAELDYQGGSNEMV